MGKTAEDREGFVSCLPFSQNNGNAEQNHNSEVKWYKLNKNLISKWFLGKKNSIQTLLLINLCKFVNITFSR